MIALAACEAMPTGWEEEGLRAALGATWAVWDDPGVDWAAFDAVVVRATWDCVPKLGAFTRWIGSVPRILNPADVLAFSLDKTYVRGLQAAGLAVVPTTFVAPGAPHGPGSGGALRWPEGAEEIVVKPAVGAGARDAGRFAFAQRGAAGELVAAIHASGRAAMLQPYLSSVDVRGETALLYAGGRFTHAVAKAPALRAGVVTPEGTLTAPELSLREATRAERALADDVIAWVGERFGAPPVYARVDLVEDAAGRPVVLELELCEPSLFLHLAPEAVAAYAAAILAQS